MKIPQHTRTTWKACGKWKHVNGDSVDYHHGYYKFIINVILSCLLVRCQTQLKAYFSYQDRREDMMCSTFCQWRNIKFAPFPRRKTAYAAYGHRRRSRGRAEGAVAPPPPLADKGGIWYQMPPFRRFSGMMPANTEKNIGICRWKCVKYY